MRFVRAVGVVVVLGVLLGAGGGDATAEPEDDDPFSAAHLGDLEGESMWEMLTPEERAAVERSGVDWVEAGKPKAEAAAPEAAPPEGGFGKKLDKAGKVGFSLLAVGLSLAAAAAPFLLF
jgi:hypothetical protein